MTRIPASTALAINFYSDPAHRPELKATWETGLRELLLAAEPGSDHQLTFARSYAGAAHSDAALDDLIGLLDGSFEVEGLAIDQDMRWALITALAKQGRFGDAEIDAELEVDKTISGKEQAAAARAAQPTAEAKDAALGRAPRPVDAQRDVARDRVLDLPLRPGGRARALPREVPRRVGDARRHAGLPQGLDDPRVRLPQAARVGGHPGPPRRVARRQLGAQAGAALRRRGACRDRPGAGRPGSTTRADERAHPDGTQRRRVGAS